MFKFYPVFTLLNISSTLSDSSLHVGVGDLGFWFSKLQFWVP